MGVIKKIVKTRIICNIGKSAQNQQRFSKAPESRAHPRATQKGFNKCGGTSPCQWSQHRKKFQRKTDNKKVPLCELYE